MPPDEPVIVESFWRSVEQIKGKAIPERLKLVLFQLIQAGISGQLLLKDGRKPESKKIEPRSILEAPYRIGPKVPTYFRNFIATKKRLREFAKSIGQQPKFLFPDTHPKSNFNR